MMPVLCLFLSTQVGHASEPRGSEKKIAILVPQSGPYAKYGNLQMEGYKLAEVDMGSHGKKTEMRYFDIGTDAVSLEELLEKNVLPWEPDIIVGPYSSFNASRISDHIQKYDIPLIIPTATLDSLTKSPSLNNYRIAPTSGFLAVLTLEYIEKNFKTWGSEKIIICAEKSTFSKGAIASIKSLSEAMDLPTIEIVEYDAGQLIDAASKTISAPNAVIISITRSVDDGKKIGDLISHKSQWFGFASAYLTPEFRKHAKDKALKLNLVNPWFDDSSSELVKDFITKFKRKYQNAFSHAEPQYHNVQAYTALRVAEEALSQSRETKHRLKDVLASLHLNTPMGDIRFVNLGGYYKQSPLTAVIQRLEEGAEETVYPFDKVNKAASSLAPAIQTEKPTVLKTLLGNQIVALFIIIALGLMLGNISVLNVNLGASGVIFVALVFGHFHFTIPSGIGTLGLVIFIYCVGISAGPAFFRAFVSKGADLAMLSVIVTGAAAIAIFACSKFFDIPIALATGIFAGSLTSTPALAAAMDNLKDAGSLVSVGYGIAYPFGVVGVVLFVQLAPKLLRKDLDVIAKQVGEKQKKKRIVREWLEIQNSSLSGIKINECKAIESFSCQISRTFEHDLVSAVGPNTEFKIGQVVLVVGDEDDIEQITNLLGKKYDKVISQTLEQERSELVVTSKSVVGKSIREINPIKNFGTVITRIERGGNSFVPTSSTLLEPVDKITVVGNREDVEKFTKHVGHRPKALNETSLLSLVIGVLLGILLGQMSFALPGSEGFSLGLSGGPLLVSLVIGHFGRIGNMSGRMPTAAMNILRDVGLVFFLAQAGIKAGGSFVSTIQEYGMVLFFVGAIVSSAPIIIGYLWATYVMKLNLLEALGGICGGMTSTPALGSITAKTDSGIPVVSYATAYPVALILMIVFVQVIIQLSAMLTF